MQRARTIVRWIFLVLALVYVAWTAPELIHNFREWRAAIPGDSVAAEFWRSAFYMDLTDVAVIVAVAIAVWWGLKPRKRIGARAPSAQV
jgi:hypothetical protein